MEANAAVSEAPFALQEPHTAQWREDRSHGQMRVLCADGTWSEAVTCLVCRAGGVAKWMVLADAIQGQYQSNLLQKRV